MSPAIKRLPISSRSYRSTTDYAIIAECSWKRRSSSLPAQRAMVSAIRPSSGCATLPHAPIRRFVLTPCAKRGRQASSARIRGFAAWCLAKLPREIHLLRIRPARVRVLSEDAVATMAAVMRRALVEPSDFRLAIRPDQLKRARVAQAKSVAVLNSKGLTILKTGMAIPNDARWNREPGSAVCCNTSLRKSSHGHTPRTHQAAKGDKRFVRRNAGAIQGEGDDVGRSLTGVAAEGEERCSAGRRSPGRSGSEHQALSLRSSQ